MSLKTWSQNLRVRKRTLLVGGSALAGLALGTARFVGGPLFDFSEHYRAETPENPFANRPRRRFPLSLEKQSTFSAALQREGLSVEQIHHAVEAAKPYLNLGRVRAGTRYGVERGTGPTGSQIGNPAGNPTSVSVLVSASPTDTVLIESDAAGNWRARVEREKVDIRLVSYRGLVTSSLWESADAADMDPNLISELAEIFSSQVDFAREVHANDRWRLIVEEKTVRGEAIGWGNIVAAEYDNAGAEHRAVLFRGDGQNKGYFAPDGSSLRKMFLKSPLRFSRISSRFTLKRFHPVLGISRPHLGVDYAAVTGTPIRAVGDGTIEMAGWSGGAGRMIKIRHGATYQSAYKHLSGWGPGIRAGRRVAQGDIIGYVGSSGLSTGPHLHFEFYVNNRFVDPLGQKFPSADPVPSLQLTDFRTRAVSLVAELPAWNALGTGRSLLAADATRRVASSIGVLSTEPQPQ